MLWIRSERKKIRAFQRALRGVQNSYLEVIILMFGVNGRKIGGRWGG